MPARNSTGPAPSGRLIDNLLRSERFRGAGPALRLIETHISWVILTGEFAYKIKKPVQLGFVDFSTLERRHAACLEELRLNRRLAPDIYLDVVAITGDAASPVLGGNGPVIDYAVRMRQFPPGAVLGEQFPLFISPGEIEQLAKDIAAFHVALVPARNPAWGTPAAVWQPIAQSLDQLEQANLDGWRREALASLRQFCVRQFETRRELIKQRRLSGAVRECHGDLHLGNLARLDGRIVPFDALEFDPALRWIDVLNETAFLVMDLEVHERAELAWRFLNHYLAVTGDYAGLGVLPLYLAYRASVRAKVRILMGMRNEVAHAMTDRLLRFAPDPLAGRAPLMILMCGVSGSGKTHLAGPLAAALGAIHLRSDVERKRLAGLPPEARTGAAIGAGIYTQSMSAMTYGHLARAGAAVLDAGLRVIVDATNLRGEQRQKFIRVARARGCAALIVHCTAALPVLVERVTVRRAAGRDASEAGPEVLQSQLREFTPPESSEAVVLQVDTTREIDLGALRGRILRAAALA